MSFGMKLFFGICLVTMVWLVTRIIRRAAALAQWHRASHPQLKHYLSTLLYRWRSGLLPCFSCCPKYLLRSTADYRTGDGHSISDQYTLQRAV